MFNVSRAMLFRWQQKYDQGGPVALETKKTPGPASRLSPTQLSKLYAIITGSDPRQLEFDFGLWTRKIIRELIRREFGVKLSEVQVGRLLNKMGLSPQRPLYRAYQQDPERVEEWKKSAYPKIRKLAAEEGASIFFADEASIRTDHHAGTTWAPVGQTPVVITTGERKSVNMVSAISPRGELRFRVQEGTMNAGKFIDFLKALLDSVPGKIFLIVDGHPVHKAKKVSEFVKEKADGRLSIFFLPPYSPDLNPDEWVWNNVKNDRIGRSVIMSADDLKAKAIGALRRLQKLPGIVRGFLRDPKLAYILELHPGTAHGVYKGISSLVRASPHEASGRPDQPLPGSACYLPAPFEEPDGVVKRALGQPGVGGLEFFEGTRQQCVGFGWAHVSPECLRGKAHEHDVGLEVVDAGQRAEVLPGDPAQAMNSCPRMADLGVVRALTKIGDAYDRYRLQAPGGLDADICFQPPRGAGAAAGEQPVDERHAMLRPGLVQEEVQAVLAKPWAAPGR